MSDDEEYLELDLTTERVVETYDAFVDAAMAVMIVIGVTFFGLGVLCGWWLL